jgi:uncharacterized protein (DUF302 family)
MSASESRIGDGQGVVTLKCSVGVDQLLRRVVVQLDNHGLELFAVVDHSGEAGEVDLAIPETKLVIFFGNPRAGTPLLRTHPLIALDLPLKLLVWETDDHDVFVSYNAPSYLADRYGLSEQETQPLRVVDTIAQAVISG